THVEAPSNCAAELWPAWTSALPIPWRSESIVGARPGVGLGTVEAGAEVSGALASAPSVSVAVSAYPIAGVATAGNGASSRCWLVDASVAVEGDGRSIAATALGEVLCLRLGAELQLPGANG